MVVPSFFAFLRRPPAGPRTARANVLSVVELMFLETSALTGENVEEGFLKCARTILNKIDTGKRVIPASATRPCACDGEAGGSDSVCVRQASWTQRGWARGSSMETHH